MLRTARPLATSLALVAVLVAALATAACGSDESASTTSSGQTASATDGGTSAGGSLDAAIKDFVFVPAQIEVTAGTTVVWTNQDRFGHTVTAGTPGEASGEFDLVLGETADPDTTGLMGEHTFDTPGTYDFFCRYHPSMQGTVTVTAG